MSIAVHRFFLLCALKERTQYLINQETIRIACMEFSVNTLKEG